jgi:hypothetical protein
VSHQKTRFQVSGLRFAFRRRSALSWRYWQQDGEKGRKRYQIRHARGREHEAQTKGGGDDRRQGGADDREAAVDARCGRMWAMIADGFMLINDYESSRDTITVVPTSFGRRAISTAPRKTGTRSRSRPPWKPRGARKPAPLVGKKP